MILPEQHEPLPEPFSCVLFDMDGTLVDSAKGVTASAAEALAAVGATVPDAEQLLRFVGPPMIDSLRSIIGLNEEEARVALEHYRTAYARTGALQARLYEGVAELLHHLDSRGIPLAVATSKVEDQAVRLTRHFGMDRYFADVCGASDESGRSQKADVVVESLSRLQSLGVDTSNPVMVGDRIHDVEGAAASGIPTIFAKWGYGTREESIKAGAVASSTGDLIPLLLEPSWRVAGANQ